MCIRDRVVAPQGRLGDITADLTSRRGQVLGTDSLGPDQLLVRGLVPLAELEGYAGRLKAITAGQGSYSLSLSHYDQVPVEVQQRLAREYRATPEED